MALGSLSACVSIPVYETSVRGTRISIPVSLFSETNLQIVRARELDYDIALRKESDGKFTALLLRCTHASNPLTSMENGFICPLHGSRFDASGRVTRGPAAAPLKRLPTAVVDESIIIAAE